MTFINVKIKNCWTEISGNITFAYSHGEDKKNFPLLVWKEKGKCESRGRRNENGNKIKKAEEEAKGPVASTSKIAGPEKIIFNLDLWKSKLTAGEEPPKDMLHALQSQLEASIGKG